MCIRSTNRPAVLVVSDNLFFLEGVKYHYRNRIGLVINTLDFDGQESDNYFLRMAIISVLERTPQNVRLVLSFHDDRVMRTWVCEARRQGRTFLNMVDTPAGRMLGGLLAFLTISNRITLSQFDGWLRKKIISPVMHRYGGSFDIADMLLAGKDMKQIATQKGVPEKTLYTRLRGLNQALDFAGLNSLYWLRLIRLCADYDAIFPVQPEPDIRLMYQASVVLA